MSNPETSMNGSIPYALGISSIVRIPIPGTGGLCIELKPRGRIPPGGSTSTLFFQDISGKKHLRLDYGYNVATKTINYHWNQARVYSQFGVSDHTPVGKSGVALYQAAKYFRYAGRTLAVAGVAIDIVSIVQSRTPMRRASEAVSGWALAWTGCRAMGAGGAAAGALASPIGIAVGGIGGCVIGGLIGYQAGNYVGANVYDWANAMFISLPQVPKP
ncbi:hypothetical protein PSUB009319_26730 [Ralstonia sp. SET104]|nr:hypothetical protein PSUB009319_26730 [Ralstonia sp. SET104]